MTSPNTMSTVEKVEELRACVLGQNNLLVANNVLLDAVRNKLAEMLLVLVEIEKNTKGKK